MKVISDVRKNMCCRIRWAKLLWLVSGSNNNIILNICNTAYTVLRTSDAALKHTLVIPVLCAVVTCSLYTCLCQAVLCGLVPFQRSHSVPQWDHQ